MSLRTGGREAVEDEQIEPTEMQIAIAERMFDEWCQYNGSDTGWASSEVDDDTRSVWIELAGVAVAEIEYDHAIVRAGDALTAEQRAAIGRSCDLHMAQTHFSTTMSSKQTTATERDDAWALMNEARKTFTVDDFKRLRAIAAGGQG